MISACDSDHCKNVRSWWTHIFPTPTLQAQKGAQGADLDWYFCRGYFLQASNCFRPYTQEELGEFSPPNFVC